jgi:hypothetical protein
MARISFVVASDTAGVSAASWFARQKKKGDVYVGSRSSGYLYKISLHEGSRICRYAQTPETAGGPRKPGIRWKRSDPPPRGLNYALYLLFPTSYLRNLSQPWPPEISRISPAPDGSAAVVGVFFSRERPNEIVDRLGATGCLLSHAPTPSGEFCGIHCFTAPEWEDVDIIVPASHSEQRELRFTADHPEGVERTISLMVPLEVENGALALVERHGYAVVPGTPYVRLSKQHYTLTRSDDHTVWNHEAWKTRQRHN